jgi:LDH2 family malate/lactate/ureidoglycolate dehydrogenase
MTTQDAGVKPENLSYVLPDDARTFIESILTAYGVPPENAAIVAKCLVEADLRGVDTHGINRIPSYLARIRQGTLDPKASPELTQLTPVVAQVDGHNSFGFLSAHMGMARAIEMAKESGIGMVSVKNSNHFGMAASFVLQAIEADMLSLVFTNSSPALAPWGGVQKLMGVSPIACGAPAGATRPFVLDMAPSVAARGKIHKALRRGEKIPADWAVDREGRPTEDPARALEGAMLPIGGPKGSGLSIMMDVFSGVLSGAAFAGHVSSPHDAAAPPANVGHFLVAIKPGLFVGLDAFKERMDYLYRRVVGSAGAEPDGRVYFPGEIEALCWEERVRDGVPLVQGEVAGLEREAERVGVQGLRVRGE